MGYLPVEFLKTFNNDCYLSQPFAAALQELERLKIIAITMLQTLRGEMSWRNQCIPGAMIHNVHLKPSDHNAFNILITFDTYFIVNTRNVKNVTSDRHS